jgi:magnesium transporter
MTDVAQAFGPPWEQLAALVGAGDAHAVRAFLESLDAIDTLRAVSRLDEEARARLFTLVDPEESADLIEQIPEVQAVEALESLPPAAAARILEELTSDHQADLIGELEHEDAEAILAAMDPEEAEEVRDLAAYPETSAGGLMITEYLEFRTGQTVDEVVRDLREHAEAYEGYDVQYGYVCDERGRLVGVLRMRDLLLARGGRTIDGMMIREPLTVSVDTPLRDLVAFFDEHRLVGVPVLEKNRELVGVVRRSGVFNAVAERSEETFRRSLGIVGGEELRSMPLLVRSRRRLGWLSANIVLNVISASVIALNQDTLQAVIALAVFLPILSDMSGCSGSQAVAVSIRELALGVLRPADLPRVLIKEIGVGLLNGAVLGLLLAAAAWLWKGNPWLGAVVGGALAVNTVVAVCVGGTIPLALKRFGRDPALASGPVLTTVTDMLGFFLVLTLAQALMTHLA